MLALLGVAAFMLAATGVLQAQGFTITSTPTFASTNVTSTSAAGNVVVKTTAATTITSITVPNSASGSPQFNYVSISGCTIGTSAPTGTTCTISVTFSPAYPAVQSAPLVIAYTGGTLNVGLVGTGLAPQAILLPGVLSTVVNTAGTAETTPGTGNNGQATAATLKLPRDINFDYAGNYYVGDVGNGQGTSNTAVIRKVTTSTGVITAFAGAGSGTTAYSSTSTGVAATSVGMNYATEAVFDSAGNAYIPDFFHNVVARVDAVTGDIKVYAGQYGVIGSAGDGGLATAAKLSGPAYLAIDPATGNLYIADAGNMDVREVNAATGIITTVAGVSGSNASCASSTAACGDGGLATAAQFNNPNGLAMDASGNLYISDSQDNRIRLVTKSTGKISTIAGTGAAAFGGDGGAATSAKLNSPFQIALDVAGNLYIADSGNNAVRLYTPSTGNIVSIAGNGTACTTLPGSSCGDGGLSNVSSLNGPTGVALDSFGNLYIVESSGNRVRKVTNNPVALNTFPTEPVGTTSATQTETLLNIGNATLTYTSPVSPNSDALVTTTDPTAAVSTSGAFAQTNATSCGPIYAATTTGTTLTSGTSCVFVVSFTPNTVAGNYTGTLVETDNSLYNTASTQTITLAGVGTKLTPTTTLGSNNNPSYLGQSVTFTATVTSPNSSAPAPTGNVTFTYTTTAAPATPVAITGSPVTVTTSVAGVTTAVISTSSLPLGTDSVTAAYNGDGAYNTASSSALPQVVQLVSGAADTVSAAASTTTLGTADQLTFAIPVITGAAVPTGSVAFTAGATSLGNATWPATPVTGTCPGGSGTCYLLSPPTAPTNIPLGSPTTVTATYTPTAASGYAAPATAPTIGVTVTLDPDTITVTSPTTSPAAATYSNGGMIPIAASSTSNQPISYATTTTTVCSVSSTGVVTTLSTGTCNVTLSQPAAGNYAAASTVTQIFNIGAGTNVITFPGLPNAVIGATPPAPAATATSGVTPTYSSTTPTVCTVTTAGVITDLTPGTCTITAAQGPTGNYAGATSVSQSFQVTPLADAITVTSPTSPDNVSYTSGGTVPIAATSTSNQPLTYSTTSPACTVSATGVITEVSTGSCVVTVSQPAAGNYAAAPSQTVTVNIGAGANTINFPALPNTPAGATAPVPAATSTAGGTITYGSTTPTICTVSGGVITDIAPGTCTITASQGTTGNYAAAAQQMQSYQVTPLTDTITIPPTVPASATVGGTVPIGATTTSGVTPTYTSTTPAICSVSATGVVTTITSGSCSVTVSQAAAGNYSAATPQTVAISVGGQAQTIQNFGNPVAATYGGTAPSLAATATSGLAPTYSATGTACSVTSTGAVTILAAGTCQITASQAGNSTYAAATPVTETLTVNPAADVITIPGTVPPSATVGGTVPIGATTTSGVTPTYTSTTPAICSVSATGVVTTITTGSCSVTVSQPAAGNYAAATPQTVSISVGGQAQTIQNFGTPITATYGGTAPVLAATATSGLAPTYSATGSACSVTTTGTVTILAAGSCQITASQVGNSTYAAATPVAETLTVNPEADVITIPGTVPGTATVGGTVPIGATTTSGVTPTYTSTTPAICSVSATGVVTTMASGTCNVSVTQPAAGNFAAATPQTVSISVGGQAQTIQNFGSPVTATYGGTAPILAATATSGLTPTYTATGTGCSVTPAGAVTLLAAGSCQITASQAGNSTYAAATPVTETVTVNPAADVITIPPTVPASATVGGTVPIGATTTSGVTPTYTSTTPAICSVSATGVVTTITSGSCSVTVSQAAAGNYSAATPQTVAISVGGQAQTIQNFGTPITTTYGAGAPILAATATSGLAPTYTATGAACSVTSSGTVTILAVGTCQITASQAGNSTYAAATPVTETLTVTPEADVITIPPTVPTSTTAGSTTPIGATTTSGVTPLYTSTTPTVCSVSATGVVTSLSSGTCTISVTQPAAGNYAAATPQTVTITVGGQSQTINNFGNPITAAYGGTAPVLAATATSGLAPTYTATGTACSVTSAGTVTILAVGTCQLTASQAGNGTYTAATPVTATLTVGPEADVITIPPSVPATATVGSSTPISATTTSGVTPVYISNTPAVCSVSAMGVATSLTTGSCSVTVSQAAAGNFAAATPQTVTIAVSGQSQSIQNFGSPISINYGSAAPVLGATATSGLATTYTAAGAACSVTSTGTVTVLATGTCQITASQAGNSTYAAATPVTETLTVNPEPDVITIPPTVPSTTPVGTNVSIGATTTSGLPPTYTSTTPAVCSVSSTGVITTITGGTCAVIVTQPAAGNFAAATPQTVNLSVMGGTNTITFPALPSTPFTSAPPAPAATATSGQPVTYSTSTPACSVTASGVVTFNSIGTCSITANQAATGSYAAATPVTQSFLITPGVDAILVPAVPTNVVPGATFSIGATSTSGGPITYVSATPTACTVTSPGGVVTVLTGGTCTITLSQPAAGNFGAAPTQTVTLNAYDFTIAANSPMSQTVVPGSVVVYTYALAPLGGRYPGSNVTYTVTGLPPGATYSLTPASGSVTQAAGSQMLTLTITTAQAVAMNRLRETAPFTLAFLLPFFLRRKLRRRLAQSLLLLLLLGAAAFTVTGCAAPNGFFGQPIANYTITVTATSGSVTHSAVPVNLQVQ